MSLLEESTAAALRQLPAALTEASPEPVWFSTWARWSAKLSEPAQAVKAIVLELVERLERKARRQEPVSEVASAAMH